MVRTTLMCSLALSLVFGAALKLSHPSKTAIAATWQQTAVTCCGHPDPVPVCPPKGPCVVN